MLHLRAAFLIPLALAPLGLVGCETPDSDETEGYFVPTAEPTREPTQPPTATPSAEPTADPNAGYHLTSLTLLSSGGVDLDGDSRADNDYVSTLKALSKVIGGTFEDTCLTALETIPLPEGTPPPAIVCKGAAGAVTQALGQLVSLDQFNANVATAMESTPYLAKARIPAQGNLALDYYFGEGSGDEYIEGDFISTHSGSVAANGDAKLGPGTFEVRLDLGGGATAVATLSDARTELRYTAGVLTNTRMGGVLTEDALIALLLGAVTATVPLPEPALGPVSAALGQVIPDCGTDDTVMEDCGDLGGLAMGFEFETEAATFSSE